MKNRSSLKKGIPNNNGLKWTLYCESRCPFAILQLRKGVVKKLETYHHVVVAVDFSEKAKIALERGVRIAKLTGAALPLVCVIDTHSFGSVEAYDLKYAKELI